MSERFAIRLFGENWLLVDLHHDRIVCERTTRVSCQRIAHYLSIDIPWERPGVWEKIWRGLSEDIVDATA